MLTRFLTTFTADGGAGDPGSAAHRDPEPSGLEEVLAGWGGTSYDGGLYRLHTVASSTVADALVADAFPDFSRYRCFGMDWLGRQFAVDARRGTVSDPEVLMFEPSTGEALEIPVPFSAFHDEELVDYREAALAASFYETWRRAGGEVPRADQCVGYRRPLFLGGRDEVSNLELTDLDVYWSVTGQLRRQTKGLAPGTRITGMGVDPAP